MADEMSGGHDSREMTVALKPPQLGILVGVVVVLLLLLRRRKRRRT